jgi:hypothetical protein
MLGQSMASHHDRVVVVNSDGSRTVTDGNGAGGGSGSASGGNSEPGFFMYLIRIFFWLAVLSALGWGIYYLAKRKGVAKQTNNYTLGKF